MMRKLNKTQVAAILVIAIIIFVSGLIIGYSYVSNSIFTLSKEINLIQLGTLLTTLFGVVFISFYLDRQKEITKMQREILLKRVDDLYETISDLYPIAENGPCEVSTINYKLKQMNLEMQRVNKVINRVKNIECEFTTNCMGLHKDLRDLMTNTPPRDKQSTEPQDIKVEKGKVSFSVSRKAQIETLLDRIETLLLEQHLQVAG